MRIELFATLCFTLAIIQTFLAKPIQRFVKGTRFQLVGKVEVAFVLWSFIFAIGMVLIEGFAPSASYFIGLSMTEPLFVFAIMTVCSTQPILQLAFKGVELLARPLPCSRAMALYISTFSVGPLLGSLITEPAAMTVTAMIVLRQFFTVNVPSSFKVSENFKYASLGLLFVNISIGGTLTSFAAPPVVMVAQKWGWDLAFMGKHFAWKAILAIAITTSMVAWRFRDELRSLPQKAISSKQPSSPVWLTFIHLIFLLLVVATSHQVILFIPIFVFFVAWLVATKKHQGYVDWHEGVWVGLFLAGLVVLGTAQNWWIEPILKSLSTVPLYLGAAGFTAVMDNAAITYLGAQVPGLAETARYALVAGAVVGGGLTVIANAPNPAGYGILNPAFKDGGINPLRLFANALPPTLIAIIIFWPY